MVRRSRSRKQAGIYKLVTLMALREAGERHHDQEGGDPAISAKAAGHTMAIKQKYYSKGSFEEAQASFEKYHPAFKEVWEMNTNLSKPSN